MFFKMILFSDIVGIWYSTHMVHNIPVCGRQVLFDDEASIEGGVALSSAPASAALSCVDGDAAPAGPIGGY